MSRNNSTIQKDKPANPRGHGPLERVTVNLTERSSRALNEAVDITHDTKTDTINRALQVYSYLVSVMEKGGALYVRENEDGELERLKFF